YNCHKTRHFARECRSKRNQDNKRRDAGYTRYKAKDSGRRPGKQEETKALVTLYGDGVDWTSHSEDEQENYALMAYNNSGLDTERAQLEAEKEKEELKAKVEKWHNSSKGLNILLNSQMSARDKAGLGYAKGMHAVPPLMTGIYLPSGPNVEADESYVETNEYVPKPVANEPKAVSDPKVWSDAPIIEEYESDSDDEHVSLPTKEQETPSCAFVNTIKHVKTPRQTVKEQNTCSQSSKPNKKDWNGLMSTKLGLGYGFTKKACFVYGSFSHLIRDCDFHEKRMAKQVEVNKQKGKGIVQRENKLVWNNVQRLNHQNKFVPTAILTRTGRFPINSARQKFSSQAASTSTARKVNTARPIMNEIRPRNNFFKSHSPTKRTFYKTTAPKDNFSNHKVNTAGGKTVSAVGGNRETADDLQKALKNKGIVDSGCSRHMTGNKAYLVDYQDYNGDPVAFGGSKRNITGKGKIRIGKLDFEDVFFVKELQHFNLFSISQMCDKKNKVLFTDTECLVLSPDFKLPDENQVLLRIPRQNNMYSFNLENIIPTGGLACLIAKATVDESNKWHMRLGHAVRTENQANKSAGPKEANHSACTQDNTVARNSEMEAEPAQEYCVLPSWSSYTSPIKSSKAKNGGDKLKKDSANDESEALRKEFAQGTKDLLHQTGAARASSTKTTKTVNVVSTPISTASPSRVFSAGESSYPKSTNYADHDDSQIPALEDIYDNPSQGIFSNASYDDEGAVADFINLDTTVNVSPIPTSRIHTIHPKTQILRDPTSAVQTRSKVNKSSGAHAFVSYIQKQRRNNHKDFQHCLFACFLSQIEPKKISEALQDESWVDAMQEELLQFKIQKVWILVDLPNGKRAIGTKWVYRNKKDERGVVTASTPIETQKSLTKDEEAVDVDVTSKTSHLNAIKRIFRYLKGKPKLGVWYPRVSSFNLEAYTDSDYAGANLDRKSTIGGCQFLGRRLISWQCKKQTIMATSTTEAEYVAAANCYGQNLVFHSKTKHIEIRHHFIKDAYEKKLIQVLKIHTDDNVADLLTKAFDVVQKLILLGLVCAAQKYLTMEMIFGLGKKMLLGLVLDAINVAMENLDFVDQHNMVACLKKTKGNSDFHEILDFLASSSIHHALTISPPIYTSYIEQFWNTARSQTVNDVKQINATVDSKAVVVTEASIRSSLLFKCVDGNLGILYKRIFMYPRFLMVFLNNQIDLGEPFNDVYPTPAHNLKLRIVGWSTWKLRIARWMREAKSSEIKEVKLTDDTKVVEDKGSDIDAARQEDSDVEPRTPPTTTSIFDDEDITMAQTLIKMKEEKAKEKGVSIKDVDDSSRPARSILTLKPLPTIDPKDKGKSVLEEPEPAKKMTRSDLMSCSELQDA
ncbi:hypothetical protein Tco_0731275, partial [Tanacetum coccineum]